MLSARRCRGCRVRNRLLLGVAAAGHQQRALAHRVQLLERVVFAHAEADRDRRGQRCSQRRHVGIVLALKSLLLLLRFAECRRLVKVLTAQRAGDTIAGLSEMRVRAERRRLRRLRLRQGGASLVGSDLLLILSVLLCLELLLLKLGVVSRLLLLLLKLQLLLLQLLRRQSARVMRSSNSRRRDHGAKIFAIAAAGAAASVRVLGRVVHGAADQDVAVFVD